MSLKIEIFLPDDGVSSYGLDYHLAALGFTRAEAAKAEPVKQIASVAARVDEPEQAADPAPAEPAKRTRKKKDAEPETQQSISTGEERISPEDDADVQEQDKADEQAEVEATRKEPVTIDDVKNAFGLYITKFGMDAVKEDGVNILADALADEKLPAGENFWKASIIPENRYADVIKAFETAASGSERYKRRGA